MRPKALRGCAAVALTAAGLGAPVPGRPDDVSAAAVSFEVRDGGIALPLVEGRGDAARGRRIAIDPARGNCLICHRVPDAPDEPFQGDIGPPLAGVARRLSAPALRLRIVDGTRLNPDSAMPAYHRIAGLHRVAPGRRGRPVLSAGEVEDVVAYLLTLDGRGR